MNKKYSSSEFLSLTDNKIFDNVFLLHGEDSFLSDKIINRLIRIFTTDESKEFDYANLYGEDTSASNIIELLDMFPFISDYKLVVVHNFDELKNNDKNRIAEYIKTIQSTSILVVNCRKIDSRTKLFKAFSRYTTIQCKPPSGYWDIEKWLSKELITKNIRANRDVISLFASKVDTDYYMAYNEFQKLLIYINGRSSITTKDINLCMGSNRSSTIFELQNAIGCKNKKKTLKLLHDFLEMENATNSIFIVVMLTRFFSIIWRVKYLRYKNIPDSIIANKHLNEVHKMFKKDYLDYTSNYKRTPIKNVFDVLLEVDYELKSTTVKPEVLLTNAIMKIMT